MGIGDIWNLIAMQPMINTVIALSSALGGSFGFTIVVFTVIIRLAMFPLTIKQLRATKAMQSLQPKLAELQKKHAKDKQKLAQEQMKMYRESGMSPAGCMVPMLVQMPIWIALYWSIMKVLAVTPEDFLGLAQFLYPWPVVFSTLPLSENFLWLNLARPDNLLLLPILVGGTMWVQQKMVTPTSTDPAQQAQGRMMLWTMPMLFALLTLQFPSGLALYWVASNLITIGIQYFNTGWGGLLPASAAKRVGRDKKYKRRIADVEQAPVEEIATSADIVAPDSMQEEGLGDEKPGDKRQDRGRGYPASLRSARRNPRRGRGHRPKRR